AFWAHCLFGNILSIECYLGRPLCCENAQDMRLALARELDSERLAGIHFHGCLFRVGVCFGMEQGELAHAVRIDEPSGEFRRMFITKSRVAALNLQWQDR